MPNFLKVFTVIFCVSSIFFTTPTAYAYRVTVLDKVSDELFDLGRTDKPHAMHIYLGENDENFQAKFVQSSEPEDNELRVYMPQKNPELEYKNSSDLPIVKVDDQEISTTLDGEEHFDDATGLSYQQIAALDLDSTTDTEHSLLVEQGEKPVRVMLLLTNSQDSKVLDDPAKIPRTITKLRWWYDTPAEDSIVTKPKLEKNSKTSIVVWLPAVISVIGLGIVIWWLRNGQKIATKRGEERYIDEYLEERKR